MESLLAYKTRIFDLKSKIENKDPSLYSHIFIENGQIDSNTISIVMTASNRSKQTYFTLKTMSNSVNKNIHVIIVDDSNKDPIDANVLKTYPFAIDFIQINLGSKSWVNPLINYNIGFKYIKGGKIIIQNAEVCHVGDLLNYINNYVNEDNHYYVFDVKASLNFETNETFYNSDLSTTDVYLRNLLYIDWYQCITNNRNLHFLTSLTKNTFDRIKEFSYDCTMGKCYDDNDFLLKIISNNIIIKNEFHNESGVGGIHLYHEASPLTLERRLEDNYHVFNIKSTIYNKFKMYVDVTANETDFNNKYNLLTSNRRHNFLM